MRSKIWVHRWFVLTGALFFTSLCGVAAAQQSSSALFADRNGDGRIVVLAFGDSITYGLGDGAQPGEFVEIPNSTDGRAGYPARIEGLAPPATVDNDGIPGEEFVSAGVQRFPDALQSSTADVVVLFEGANDAGQAVTEGPFRVAMQRAVNVAHALSRPLVIATIPPTCCNRAGRGPFLSGYNAAIREIAELNSIATLADIERAWSTTCTALPECQLLNLPEGLHPNAAGYDVIAQTILASLVDIDIFAASGARQLEERFSLAPGTIVVKPDASSGAE